MLWFVAQGATKELNESPSGVVNVYSTVLIDVQYTLIFYFERSLLYFKCSWVYLNLFKFKIKFSEKRIDVKLPTLTAF